ncbi:MAG: CbiX/SirB N-terminal domain-containing protein [Armatimonadetes bacterium]|nr:CbiX/SirB N-terminal domain-containing protein [Armatimonadota bacterium]
MNALLVLVHGSPRPVANNTMFEVVETLKKRPEVRERFPLTAVGFMECNEPDIPGAIANLVGDGATAITAVPYFLHTGTHVCEDLPTLLEEAQTAYPHVSFRMGDYLGLSPRMASLLGERANVVR